MQKRTQTKNKSLALINWIMFIVLIFVLSLANLEALNLPTVTKGIDYRHILIFVIFIPLTKSLYQNLGLIVISIIALAFGILIEGAQELFTQGARHFHWEDIVSNCIGIIAGIGIWLIIQHLKGEKKIKKEISK